MNIRIGVWASPESADFQLYVQVYRGDEPIATIASFNVDDPNLGRGIRNILHAFQMGTIHGQTTQPTYATDAWTGYTRPEDTSNSFPVATDPALAGNDLPPRDEGMVEETKSHTTNLIPLQPRDYSKY